jgi:hypothetical protein
LEGADLRDALIDASALTTARVAGAKVDMSIAVGFARAHGLVVDLGEQN